MAEPYERSIIVEQGKIVGEGRLWADLPSDLLYEILSRLLVGDQAAFRCVCGSWKSAPPLIITQKQLSEYPSPYLISFKNKIYHPISGDSRHIDFLGIPSAKVIAVKDGWLLVSERNWDLYFFNPFTKSKIRLPDLPCGNPYSIYISAPPTSEDWMIVCSETDIIRVPVWSIKCGDATWTLSEFLLEDGYFNFDSCSAVKCKGQYYFLGIGGELLIHDRRPKRNTFKFYDPPKILCEQLRSKYAHRYMMESDGKVLAVFVSCDGSLIRICQWDVYKKIWEEVGSLGNRMLFVSDRSSICERSVIRGTGNKIYFPRFVGNRGLFYSLSTNKYHTFAGGSYRSFNGSCTPAMAAWINP